jgi:hypothetical protein
MLENQNSPDALGSLFGQMSPPVADKVSDKDQLSKFYVDFKAGAEPQTTQWIRLASLVASHSFSCDIVIRTLGSKENVADGSTSLDKLGVAIARKTNAKYCPSRLQKVTNGLEGFFDGGERGQYKFDKSFLPAKARVLVIGDPDTKQATFDAITKSILEALPEAEVKIFTLAWLGEHVKGAHLDGKYFMSHASPAGLLHEGADTPVVPPALTREEKGKKVKKEPAKVAARSAKGKKHSAKSPVPTNLPSAPLQTGSRKKIMGKLFIAAAAFLITALAIMALVSRSWVPGKWSQPGGQDLFAAKQVQPVEPKPVAAPAPEKKAPNIPAERKPDGPTGIVTVPRVGLRSGPSLSSKPVKASVKNNERVTILRRRASSAGPDWIQVRTSKGTVGWVWASVLREVRPRK